MIDVNLIRQDAEAVRQRYLRRGKDIDFSAFLQLDEERKSLIAKVEGMKAERNKVSGQIPQLKKQGQDVSGVIAEMKALGDKIAELDGQLNEVNEKIRDFLLRLPNLPDEDLLAGGKENNKPIKVFGEKPHFDFQPKDHVELAKSLGLIDYERGAKLAGNGSWIYTGLGARLEWALLNYFIDSHIAKGYEFMLPPYMLSYECGLTAGQFPKFEDDVYQLANADGKKFLLPTAETALVNLYRDEILPESQLPRKFFGYSACFRREAGSYRAEERGMIRGHQFNKVELFQYTTPEQSDAAFEEMVGMACGLVEGLGLHYQLSKLAAGDCSDSMARTYDIEIYIPSMNIYKEVSSASNARCYQARRGNMRYRRESDKKLDYMHTLNASGLATSRVFPALLEQNQNADGSVTIPEVLRKYMGGLEKLVPIKK
ncbi:MAG: serine--tRNA ligase [Clostridia bacterium]|nr:serine--tRNA ligase [Clostridia bacterium]MBQ4272891.1 serine--tRNA ligase [Clostridia bacterium]MBR1955574.1 serine--tRNA ligase [Clostridia bacterium]